MQVMQMGWELEYEQGESGKEKVKSEALNTLLSYYTILNYGNIPSPRIKMNKKEAVVDQTAERDKLLKEMGVEFTKEYFKKRYNLSDNDFNLLQTKS
jgi:hypothetical protein